MAVEHYENFPVASLLLPGRLRPAVEAIYAFARSADDIADEGDADPSQRLVALDAYVEALKRIETGARCEVKMFSDLGEVIDNFELPLQPFRDLLSAFRQDVGTTRYATYTELLDYCSRSANPVGVLMLHLYQHADARNLEESNAICSALQIINFLQDIGVDWQKHRVYLPQEDMARFGVTERHIALSIVDEAWRRLMQFEVNRARALMLSGAALPLRLPGRIGWELRLVVQGGLRILERIETAGFDVFGQRPQLGPRDWIYMAWRALGMKISLSGSAHVG